MPRKLRVGKSIDGLLYRPLSRLENHKIIDRPAPLQSLILASSLPHIHDESRTNLRAGHGRHRHPEQLREATAQLCVLRIRSRFH
jgi:hypothetical protein